MASVLLPPATGLAAPEAGERAKRVVVAGPEDDPIAARVQRELTALGFEAIRAGALEGCARSAVIIAALDNHAIAAACSDGDQVGVWIADGNLMRLRDVVFSRDDAPSSAADGDRTRETTAVRAAEVTRATIAQHEAEEVAARNAPPPAPVARGGWDDFEKADKDKPAPKPSASQGERHAPRFAASAGASALIGVDAAVGAVSGQITVAVWRRLSLAARLEYPFESQPLSSSRGPFSVTPGLAAAGVELPLFRTSSFIIPRFGAGVGAAWMRATRLPIGRGVGDTIISTSESSETIASPAGYVSAGVSMRIYGPVRLMADGLFGTTLSRFVARDSGERVAYWGQPLAALSMRAEVMIP